MKAIDLPPFAPILIESTRAIGYSLEAAIADIIDNSIAADASNVHVRFFPVDEPYLAIIDDGCGMDDEEITQAMQYGSANPLEKRSRKDLGRFGLGLKTASLSQCRQLTVVSKNGSHYVGRRWDIDFVNSTGKWSLIVLNEEEIWQLECIDTLQAFPTGTMVLWKNLDRMQKGEINFIHSIRGDVSEHRTMMIHVSRFTDMQNRLREAVYEWFSRLRTDIKSYSKMPLQKAMAIDSIAFTAAVWDKYNLSEAAHITWEECLSHWLTAAISPIEVRAVNQKTGASSLDYFNHPEDGLRVIAVGGNSMSRGITLEGLCVSYFYRRSQMYDTLMQMGRWFGYRPNYQDIFRIWISSEAIDWYPQTGSGQRGYGAGAAQ